MFLYTVYVCSALCGQKRFMPSIHCLSLLTFIVRCLCLRLTLSPRVFCIFRFYPLHKVAGVRDATAGAPAPQFIAAPVGCELRFFQPVTPNDVIKLVQALQTSSARRILCLRGR